VPKHLVQAVMAAEDRRFFEHHGVDARAVGRAVWVNLRRGGVSQGLGSQQTLKLEDVDAIRKACPSVSAITPEYRGSAQVQFANQNTRTSVFGGSPEYFDIHNLPLADGRAFTESEVRSRA